MFSNLQRLKTPHDGRIYMENKHVFRSQFSFQKPILQSFTKPLIIQVLKINEKDSRSC